VLTFASTGAAVLLKGDALGAAPWDAAIAVLHGAFILSAGLFLFGQGSRFIPGVTFTMLAQAEAVFSPIWGALFFGERPGLGVIIGGALILTAVVVQAIDGARQITRSAA
jgi:drug/metabolite transporter, DME family